jgi:hypothetical protein
MSSNAAISQRVYATGAAVTAPLYGYILFANLATVQKPHPECRCCT